MIAGEDFIRLAGRLCVLRDADEAGFRTAIGRAYYGTFHIARLFLKELGFPVPANANAHSFVRNQLVNCGHAIAGAAGTLLTDLHKSRIRADYDLHDPKFEAADFARLNVERAHDIRRMLHDCRDEPLRSDVRAGIVDYQAKLPGGGSSQGS